MTQLSWFWIGLAATVPAVLAALVAFLFWRKRAVMLGNSFGTAVIFTAVIASIGREYNEIQRFVGHCVKLPCAVHPDPFTRFAIYGFIGIFQIAGLFVVSLRLEERARRRSFSPEWR